MRVFHRRITLAALAMLPAACAPATDDPLLDYVVAEVEPFADCLTIGQTAIEHAGPATAPGAPVPQVFADPQARSAAQHLASRSNLEHGRGYRSLGDCGVPGDAPRKATFVGEPQVSGEYAFVQYHAASGEMGVFAFRRMGGA